MQYILSILLIFSFTFCNQYEATVYLKDGSVIHGTIIDEKVNFYIQIQSKGRMVQHLDPMRHDRHLVERGLSVKNNQIVIA